MLALSPKTGLWKEDIPTFGDVLEKRRTVSAKQLPFIILYISPEKLPVEQQLWKEVLCEKPLFNYFTNMAWIFYGINVTKWHGFNFASQGYVKPVSVCKWIFMNIWLSCIAFHAASDINTSGHTQQQQLQTYTSLRG